MVVAYDGTDFSRLRGAAGPAARAHGRRRARRTRSARCCGTTSSSTCAGRTDAGVHAWGQVVSFPTQPGLDPWKLAAAVTRCSVPRSSCGRASSSTRRSTRGTRRAWRRYRYTIVNRPVPDPFRDRFAWWVPEPLDLRALRLAADPFVGEHDFASFCRKGPRGLDDDAHACSSRVGRRGRRRAALRDPRRRVLLADGARDRRHARRGRRRQAPAGRDARRHRRARPRARRASSRRRAGSASGTSATRSTRSSPGARDVRRF